MEVEEENATSDISEPDSTKKSEKNSVQEPQETIG